MQLAVLGASGHGKVVADAAEDAGWETVVVFDDAWPDLHGNGPWKVEGDSAELFARVSEFDGVVVAIGDNGIRRQKQEQLVAFGAKLATIVHPAAHVSRYASIEVGSVVFAHAVVNACVSVGEGSIINTGAIIEHDCLLAEFVHISPNAVLAGGVQVGAGSWIGASASVRQSIVVGKLSVVGMGAVVTRNVPDQTTVIGSPARALNRKVI
ncbi:MAG: acetyltransferase [Pseudomonadota bacterium]